MKVVIPGGTGQVGTLLRRTFEARGFEVIVLSRHAGNDPRVLPWDGRTLGPWRDAIDGADVVINLAGRNVNCRYTPNNLQEMMDSRVDSARVVGAAIAAAARPPAVWLQMSTATIYAHRFDAPNDEATGRLGGDEPDAPRSWNNSIEIAKAWEAALYESDTPATRKIALRAAMVMSPDRGGIFDLLMKMVHRRLGGPIAGGQQWFSWIHEVDFVEALAWLIEHDAHEGAWNLAAPTPLPQRDFMAALRSAAGVSLGLPASAWMATIGAFFMRTETELLFKSRRVIPGRLLQSGFDFTFPDWPPAARDLVARWKTNA